jgi:uncharacterized protein YndB with AHSA1/START domain
MKYTISIEIDLPREKVVQLIADPAHMPKWLRGLVLHEPVDGEHGRIGTTSRVVFQIGKQRMEDELIGVETTTTGAALSGSSPPVGSRAEAQVRNCS